MCADNIEMSGGMHGDAQEFYKVFLWVDIFWHILMVSDANSSAWLSSAWLNSATKLMA